MEDGTSIEISLYERDFTAWAEAQAEALRRRGTGRDLLDYDNLAEEIEDVAKHVARTCRSYLDVIIEHLLKLQFAPSAQDERGWKASVKVARRDLSRELTPTLRARLPDELAELFEDRLEILEAYRTLADADIVRAELPVGYSWEQLTDPDWWPPRTRNGEA